MGMHFAQESCSSQLMIRSCGDGQITIGETRYEKSLILTPGGLVQDWRPRNHQELEERDFEQLRLLEPEIVLLGTGPELRFPSARLSALLLQAGIGLEVMDTAAACRTFNILLAEERQVAAALLLR